MGPSNVSLYVNNKLIIH